MKPKEHSQFGEILWIALTWKKIESRDSYGSYISIKLD